MFLKIQRVILLFIFTVFTAQCAVLGISIPKKDKKQEKGWQKMDAVLKLISEPVFPDKDFNLADFGAKGDGIFNNKPVFDSIISVCSKNGGGRVVVPAGTFFIGGPIHLKSNINLCLQKGSKLTFSNNPKDYLPVVLTSWEGTRLYNYSPFIYTFQQKNIAITGEGEIDGEASETWHKWKKKQEADKLLTRKMNNENIPVEQRIFGEGHWLRPHLIQFYECENILIDGIKITDSPFWCIHPIFSKNIIVRNVKYDAQNYNNDGVDPESSENVLIENIDFNNQDDNIAIKAGRDLEARTLNRPSKNMVIRNCRFGGYNAFAIGSEMSGGVNNVFVENCSYSGNVIYGIYLKGNLDRGGEVSDIYVRNIEFDATESAILIDSYYKEEGSCCPPLFKNIFIEDVTCKTTRDYGISLIGAESKPLENISIKNVTVHKPAKQVKILHVNQLKIENVKLNGEDFKLK